ncbi:MULTISPECIES: helix-turn-helix transcriptional regulator [unclassified Streptomyces]|uniref:helix-turn-helix domain-containing protein n=1 Tax=unclassified Streptomyces TaxID=2593676 RepID=UPI002006DDBC|nr:MULTISPECIES: helix-turn-helix transcriptional regulator [unclassified Streptomyces]
MRTPSETSGPTLSPRDASVSAATTPGVPVPRTFDGPRFRDQRRLAGLSAEDIATRIGCSPWSVWRYERGALVPPIPVADALADAIGLPLERLLVDDLKAA